MSKADEMFKELGYKYERRELADVYIKTDKDHTRQYGFNKEKKSVMLGVHYITMQELQAINKKVEELNWNE